MFWVIPSERPSLINYAGVLLGFAGVVGVSASRAVAAVDAARRSWGNVVGVDFVPALLERALIKISAVHSLTGQPVTEEFATLTPVLAKDPKWVADISEFYNAPSAFGLISDYFTANPDVDKAAFSLANKIWKTCRPRARKAPGCTDTTDAATS